MKNIFWGIINYIRHYFWPLIGMASLLVLIYLMAIVTVFPARFQSGLFSEGIGIGHTLGWVDLLAAYAILLLAVIPAYGFLKKVALEFGHKPLELIVMIFFSPTFHLLGRWYWKSTASGAIDQAPSGANDHQKAVVLLFGLLASLGAHSLVIGLGIVLASWPLWVTPLLFGEPVSIPCIILSLFRPPDLASMGICTIEMARSLVDWSAVNAFFVIGTVWFVIDLFFGFLLFQKLKAEVDA